MSSRSKESDTTPNRRIERIRKQIASLGLVAQGTISKRTKVCGKHNCRCAHDTDARHGPYYEWTRRQKGRYVHTVITADQAKQLAVAIDNHRRLRALLARWCVETARVLKM
jgi:hypothetical protein